ncbi:23S rRNA (adenine(2503)-C(2))-methyltransferase RlmN [Longimicrobium sp.]|uniref:23S rRNA (adenine(2503)-C(2))-methyltransferase RlmN n=1 Tax=Longimicrobium sp. TaxID=2029185 RepID=UPI002E349058|nr:23S rRNA (adenine(2503)-C(2))-methyltransferase RlmN [Longimicrobium sp.]HEX6040631.1 23S rRNA (adenine(2503)-C(2))-methyltransferase RlmN [Longimicrobium sp.]
MQVHERAIMIATPQQTQATARPDLVGMLPEDADAALRAHFAARGQPAYRVGQVVRWIFERGAFSFAEMTDLPQAERAALAESFSFTGLEPAKVSRSVDGTAKHLWRLADGDLIESVLIPTPTRLTLCISSQAGCAMACTFCATGWAGYRRQLTPGEIVAQFRGARRWAQENGYDDVTNIVFMGMGEPLMNPKALFPTLAILNRGYKFGARRITISTVGVVPGILRLAEMPEQYRLAVSLHAPNHDLRQKLIPLEKKYPLPELLESLRRFDAAGGKRITFEYVMIDGVTDQPELADELAEVVKEFTAFVNLIPFNPIPGTDWKPSKRARLDFFVERLKRLGVTAAVRESRGRDIAAACGQLRAEVTEGRTPVQMGSI